MTVDAHIADGKGASCTAPHSKQPVGCLMDGEGGHWCPKRPKTDLGSPNASQTLQDLILLDCLTILIQMLLIFGCIDYIVADFPASQRIIEKLDLRD